MKSAPIRRLRHPLEENPLWGVLGSALAGILALVVGLPVLLIVCILIPFCLLGRWLLLFIFWNRQTSAATQGIHYTYLYTPKCIQTHVHIHVLQSQRKLNHANECHSYHEIYCKVIKTAFHLWEIKSRHNCKKFYVTAYSFMVPVPRILQQYFLQRYSNKMAIMNNIAVPKKQFPVATNLKHVTFFT
jgi:hypothetical protein